MISFAQHIANLETELKKTTRLTELRRLTSTLRKNVAVMPMLHADDSVAAGRLVEIESFIEAGSRVVATCRLITNGFKSLAVSPNRSVVVARLVNLRAELRLQMARVERLCWCGFNDWAALALWRALVLKAEEGVLASAGSTDDQHE